MFGQFSITKNSILECICGNRLFLQKTNRRKLYHQFLVSLCSNFICILYVLSLASYQLKHTTERMHNSFNLYH